MTLAVSGVTREGHDALKAAYEAGVVVVYVPFGHTGDVTDEEALHREVAIAGVEVVWEGRSMKPVAIDREAVTGERIGLKTFYGWGWDPARRLLMPVDIDPGPREFGYASAFATPPYPLGIPLHEAERLFVIINDEILDSPDEETPIWMWRAPFGQFGTDPDVWHPIFDSMWFGTCVWTVEADDDQIVAIVCAAAS
jgi:hypothetical protein